MKSQEIAAALKELLEEVSACAQNCREEEIRTWLMAATLQIWAGNRLFSEAYVPVLPVFTGQTFTRAQVITALDCLGNEMRELKVPGFFKTIAEQDVQRRASDSRDIADAIGRFLVLPALVNGDFTLEEASALRGISDLLLGYCDERGVRAGKARENRPEMITTLNRSSYYQPAEAVQREDLKDEKPASAQTAVCLPEEERPAPSITLNINLTPEAGEPRRLTEKLTEESGDDVGVQTKKPAEDDEETLESVLAELHGLVGLDRVKQDVQSLLNFIRICQLRTQRGMKVPTISYHLVFTGNPGTGKTTVARLVAKLYYLMGILPQGQLVETDRSGLVAGYLGQTAIKTQKVIQEALGGVLFIDEAYALANDEDDSYGKEAIETILKAMEDHRDELVVIVAGYDELMHKFIDSNPGLRSRFNKYFHFPDYDGEDLLRILNRFCATNGYDLSEEALPHLQERLNEAYQNREEHFGNARAVRNLFEHAIHHQADRLVRDPHITDRELAELTLEDILPALEVM